MDLENGTILSKAKIIRPINRNAVHHICSGQVVFNLAIAVKELVENSIDASATNIEIRLKDYGRESVEVCDNGVGVRKENFEALALKHYTSKLQEIADLESVATLGFRGEALSSLCALADVTVTARHKSSSYATKVRYDLNGKIVSESPAARDVGTTVILENLFARLPVRRKEFEKNLKRDYNRTCQLLYAYCLVCRGIKFTCSNRTKSGSVSTVISTEGSHSIRENIINIFGPNQVSSLVTVELCKPEQQILEECKLKFVPGEDLPFTFEFLISSCRHGSGRSTNDRQFYYMNSRPYEPNAITKLINEIYKQFNCNQYPFVFLNVQIERALVDVNVTPDKRQIFVEKEKLLLATLKSSLLDAFKNVPSTYDVQHINTINDKQEVNKGRKRLFDGSLQRSIFDSFKKRSRNTSEVTLISNSKQSLLTQDIEKQNLNTPVAFTCKMQKEDNDIIVKSLQPEEMSGIEDTNENVKLPSEIETFCLDNKNAIKSVIRAACVRSSMDYLRGALNSCRVKSDEKPVTVYFRSEISPASNKSAEEELQRRITKNSFKNMDIVGQFNLGFIITKLENDLFIIDQHATDEKYHFEELQANTVLESQSLVSPKPVELAVVDEEILIDNEDVFRRNGFSFIIDNNAPATEKVKLSAIPVSKNYMFGKDDIEEMLFMLQEGTNATECRPSRVRAMFASRACRKSVMVGCPLTKIDMRRLVDHMSEIDQPWNCPHGRPTMRHLVNLRLLQNN